MQAVRLSGLECGSVLLKTPGAPLIRISADVMSFMCTQWHL